MRKLLSAYSVLLCLVSCDMDYLAVSKPEYVVEGWIESGEHPLVMVSKTIPADGKARSVRDLGEFVVEMAHVAVIDETTGKNYTLVGHIDNACFPPYVYSSSLFTGEPGHKYRLTVRYGSFYARAETVIPEAVPLEDIRAERIEGSGDYIIRGTVNNDPSESRYYRCFTLVEGQDTDWAPSCMGTYESMKMERRAEIPIYKGVRLPETKDKLVFSPGSKVGIKFCTMDEFMYEYWIAFENMNTLAKNPLFPTTADLPSNIDGALGYWAGYGLYRADISVPESPQM